MIAIDLMMLVGYTTFACMFMVYITDGNVDYLALFMAGYATAGLGALIMIVFDKMKKKDGRKQEG